MKPSAQVGQVWRNQFGVERRIGAIKFYPNQGCNVAIWVGSTVGMHLDKFGVPIYDYELVNPPALTLGEALRLAIQGGR